jgi:hypothetical protein
MRLLIVEDDDNMNDEAAEQTLRAIISWARYAEAFACDDETAMFSLENPAYPSVVFFHNAFHAHPNRIGIEPAQ